MLALRWADTQVRPYQNSHNEEWTNLVWFNLETLQPEARLLAGAVALDLLIGDPVYAGHPVRLMGKTLSWCEDRLRAAGCDGYGGGITLFLLLAVVWVAGSGALLTVLSHWSHLLAFCVSLFLIYSMLALRDLVRHAWAVERAARRNDVEEARQAISCLVGRDISRMDIAACRRAAIESLSENLTDGFVSPLFWYTLGGLPGIVLFKVVSTMDSMVGYKTARYLRFGWCGARLDDLMNFVPARITWLLIATVALFLPRCSSRKALIVGWRQHAIVPGPNSGWSEAATAGALQRKLVGPIWAHGQLVTEVWLGDPTDAAAGGDGDIFLATVLIVTTGMLAATLAILSIGVLD